MNTKFSIKQGAFVRYRVEVINPDGTVAQSLPVKKNLILDRGLEDLAHYRWNEVIRYAAAGTGAEPTRRDSGAVTFTQAAKIVTASAGFFVAKDAGRILKLNTGEELRIEAYTSATQVTVATARNSAAATPGTIWYVNQTGLETEAMRTETYGTGADDNTVSLLDGKIICKRTFIFAAVTQQKTIREVGWSYHYSAGGNLFGRDVLAGEGVTLIAGQQLKIVLELVITITPLAPERIEGPFWIGGGGAQQLENVDFDYWCNPCRYDYTCFLGDANTPFRAPALSNKAGSLGGENKSVRMERAAYVTGSHRYEHKATFTLNDGNLETIRSIGMGWYDYYTLYPMLRIVFDQPQKKDSDHTLILEWVIAWDRTLIN